MLPERIESAHVSSANQRCATSCRAGVAGISRETLAERAGVSRYSILKWENSSHAAPQAFYAHLCRAVDVLEAEGVRFTENGV
jgi:hypothetical protein